MQITSNQPRTFAELDSEAAELYGSGDPLADGVNHIIAHAADNTQAGDGSDDLAMRSVADLLAYTEDKTVRDWFEVRGVRW